MPSARAEVANSAFQLAEVSWTLLLALAGGAMWSSC